MTAQRDAFNFCFSRMFQSGGVLQVGVLTALEERADPSPFNLDPQQTWFNFTAPNALATFSLTRQ